MEASKQVTSVAKKGFIAAISVILALLMCTVGMMGCSSSNGSSSDQIDHSPLDLSKIGTDDYEIRLAMTKGNPNPVAIINALEEGFFEESGANVALTIVEDMGTAYSSVATDQMDTVVAMNLSLNRIAEGEENLYMTGGIMSEGGVCFVAPDSDIVLNGPEDFRGLTICGIQADSELIVIEDMLLNAGLERGKDYNVIYTENMAVNIENVKNGTADVGILNGVPVYMIGVKSGCKIAAYNEDLVGKYPCCRMTVNQAMVTDHKYALAEFLMGELKGYQFFLNNKEKTIQNLQKFTGVDAESLEAVYYGTDDFRTAMEIIMDPQVDYILDYYECYKTDGFIDAETAADLDEYFYNEAYLAALDKLIEEEPNEPLWQELKDYYPTVNTRYQYNS